MIVGNDIGRPAHDDLLTPHTQWPKEYDQHDEVKAAIHFPVFCSAASVWNAHRIGHAIDIPIFDAIEEDWKRCS